MYNSAFYKNLKKPEFTPKGDIFMWIWSVLYSLMILSICIILATNNELKSFAVGIFLFQLFLNILWSPVFFILKKIKIALYLCVFLTITVTFMIYIFLKISSVAAFLQIPYLLWLIFADVLNYVIVKMNPKI